MSIHHDAAAFTRERTALLLGRRSIALYEVLMRAGLRPDAVEKAVGRYNVDLFYAPSVAVDVHHCDPRRRFERRIDALRAAGFNQAWVAADDPTRLSTSAIRVIAAFIARARTEAHFREQVLIVSERGKVLSR